MGDVIEELLALARVAREEEEHFAPMIAWEPKGGGGTVVARINRFGTNVAGELDQIFRRLREMVGDPVWLAVTLDSYARPAPLPSEGPGGEAVTSLESAFQLGDMSVVEQMVTIYIDTTDRELLMMRQVYRWTPVDGWEWEKIQRMDPTDDSICNAVRLFK